MIYGVFGLPRSGKTTCLCKLAKKAIKRGEKALNQKQHNRRRNEGGNINSKKRKESRRKERRESLYHLNHLPNQCNSIQKETKPVST